MSTISVLAQDVQIADYSDIINGKEWIGLAGVIAAHVVFLAGLVYLGIGKHS